MNVILNLTFIILISVSSSLLAYTSNIQTTTLWFSKKFLDLISIKSPISLNHNKLQAIITPKSQSLRHLLIPAILIVLFANCLFLHWYYFLIALVSVFIITILIDSSC